MYAALLRLPDDLDRFLRRHMAHMIVHTRFLGELHIPLHLLPFRCRVDADMLMRSCIFSVMDAPARSKLPVVLAMRRDQLPEPCSFNHRLPHDLFCLHACSVIRKSAYLRCQCLHLAKLTAALSLDCDGAEGIHMHQGVSVDDVLFDLQIFGCRWNRIQIRHGAYCGIAAVRRCLGACFYRFLIRKTGLSEMYMYITEARND